MTRRVAGRRCSRWIALVVLACGIVVVLGAAWWFTRLADPATAQGPALWRWLVLRDLSQEPAATRAILIERLESELQRDIPLSGPIELDPSYKDTLCRNIELLMRDWFQKMVDAYYAQAADQRAAYVDAQLDRLTSGALLERVQTAVTTLSDTPATPTNGKRNTFAWLLAKIRRWTNQAGADQRQRMEEFVAAVQARWLMRQMPKLLGADF